MTAVYAAHADAYADAGMPVFPVDTRRKRPAVRGWQNADPRRARIWRGVPNLAAAEGVGLLMGRPSGVTEIDVDAVGGGWITVARERFGDTSIIIRTASGKAKLWYRHNGEGRHIRPFNGLPIDVLGGGFTIAPPSWRDDLGEAYTFIKGGLSDIANLPGIHPGALSGASFRAPETVQHGERNRSLFYHCMSQSSHCDDVEALLDVAHTWADALPEAPTLERVIVAGWQPINGRVAGYWWYHEDHTDEHGRPMDRPAALLFVRLSDVLPAFPDGPVSGGDA